MTKKQIVIGKKTITAPMIVNELELIEIETGKNYCSIAYEALVKMITERIKQREMSKKIVNDEQSMNTLKFEVRRLLDKY